MTNISDDTFNDMLTAALAAAHPDVWSAPGKLRPEVMHSDTDSEDSLRVHKLRAKMQAGLRAALATAPAPERSEEAQNLAIELGQLASRVARLASVQPASGAEQPVSTSNPSPEAQLIADFYAEVKTDRMGTVTGFEVGALDGRLIQVRDEIKRLRAALRAARESVTVDAARVRGEALKAARETVAADISRVKTEALRRENVLQSRIELLEEEVRSLTVARPKTAPKTGSPFPPPPLSDDVTEKIFNTLMGWMERGLDSINTKLDEGKKKDEK